MICWAFDLTLIRFKRYSFAERSLKLCYNKSKTISVWTQYHLEFVLIWSGITYGCYDKHSVCTLWLKQLTYLYKNNIHREISFHSPTLFAGDGWRMMPRECSLIHWLALWSCTSAEPDAHTRHICCHGCRGLPAPRRLSGQPRLWCSQLSSGVLHGGKITIGWIPYLECLFCLSNCHPKSDSWVFRFKRYHFMAVSNLATMLMWSRHGHGLSLIRSFLHSASSALGIVSERLMVVELRCSVLSFLWSQNSQIMTAPHNLMSVSLVCLFSSPC